MKRIRKAALLVVRYIAVRVDRAKLYNWAETRLYPLRNVNLMPDACYCRMYRLGMTLVEEKRFLKLADWMIHRIPYNVRCELA